MKVRLAQSHFTKGQNDKYLMSDTVHCMYALCGRLFYDTSRDDSYFSLSQELDHHCPWSGKCIAKKNLKYFHWFLTCFGLHVANIVITSSVVMSMTSEDGNG